MIDNEYIEGELDRIIRELYELERRVEDLEATAEQNTESYVSVEFNYYTTGYVDYTERVAVGKLVPKPSTPSGKVWKITNGTGQIWDFDSFRVTHNITLVESNP